MDLLTDVKQFGVLTKAANRENQERHIAAEKRREERETIKKIRMFQMQEGYTEVYIKGSRCI